MTDRLRPSHLRVDLDAVAANVRRLGALAGTGVCAVVKADAYGHGAVPVARAALAGGASWLAVALVEEGATLRRAGIDAPVLVLSEPPSAAVAALLDADLAVVAYTPRFLAALDAAAGSRGRPARVHLKVDTGMGRVGAPPADWDAVLDAVGAAAHLEVEGVMTHLACADDPASPATAAQLDVFDDAVAAVRARGLAPRWVHAANTAGTLLHPRSRHDLVRPGIGIYGLSPGPEVDAADHGLVAAGSLVSAVGFVKRVAAGTPVSYGHRWHAPTDGWLATVPIGYADGVPRRLTGRGEVLVDGARRPIAGTVTMDQLVVWCGADRPEVGAEVVLVGARGGDRLRFEDWAGHVGSITYEVASQVTARVPRVHVHGEG